MCSLFRATNIGLFYFFIMAFIFCLQEQIQKQNIINHEIEQQELNIQQQFKNQVDNKLQEWVIQQNDWNSQYPQIQAYESFIFNLQSQTQFDFRIKSAPSTSKLISVTIFYVQKEDITVPQNPNIQSYVQILTKNSKSGIQKSEGIVYIQKIFQIQFSQVYKYIRIVNNIQTDVLILVNMEENDFKINSKVSDDKFYIAKAKMQAIKKQMQATQSNREHMFKFQWGFYDKRQRHERDMLQLTGAQLTAIIVTSIVQMYCIKNLIGHQLII